MSVERTSKELALPPHTYAYTQDLTTGQIKTYTGPTVINQTAQERPIWYDETKGAFRVCDNIEQAMRKNPIAVEGYYIVLFNPADDGQHPQTSLSGKAAMPLTVGRRINIPGPCDFPLWPGQAAHHVKGHGLRSDQYLLVQVYNEEEARKNWDKAVIKTTVVGDEDTADITPIASTAPDDLSVGRLFVIKGTEVSFYIPPTGIKVVKDNGHSNAHPGGEYTRDALTLERLEYCVLTDENGNKRYEKGPQVVFPEPTEKFKGDKKGNRKSRAFELNEIQGLHVKVISDYTDDDGVEHSAGEELFITGADTSIYYPREEHVLVKYDGRSKHFATAIPAGEGRYVMDRITGQIKTIVGPAMVLPDPRHEVFVRRPLSENQVAMWYPGNTEAAAYNELLREIEKSAPTTRSGVVSEGDMSRGSRRRRGGDKSINFAASVPAAAAAASALMDESFHGDKGGDILGDEFSRGSTYTQPRSITLDSKYQGAPTIDVWTGYAVQVVSKTGERRVVIGPQRVILNYEETLEVIALSTGKPKTTEKLLKTTFLRVSDNHVTDFVEMETKDHISVAARVIYQINFMGDDEKWFAVSNYIKRVCDHARSVLRGAVRKMTIAEFYASPEDIVRDTILGAKPDDGGRIGMVFGANGAVVEDVEVMTVAIKNGEIDALLQNSQVSVIKTELQTADARRRYENFVEMQTIKRAEIEEQHKTDLAMREKSIASIANNLAISIEKLNGQAKELELRKENLEREAENNKIIWGSSLTQVQAESTAELERMAAELEMEKERIVAETESMVSRFGASQEGFSEALIAISRNETLVKTAEAMSVQNLIGGKNFSDVVVGLFDGTPLAGAMKTVAEGTQALVKTNGKSRRGKSSPAAPPA